MLGRLISYSPYSYWLIEFIVEGSNAEVGQLIAGTNFVKMPDMASSNPSTGQSMPCLASFFDAISGVKKLSNFIPVSNCTISVFNPSVCST